MALNDLTPRQAARLDGVMQGVRAPLGGALARRVGEAAESKRGGGLRRGERQKGVWEEYSRTLRRYDRVSDESEAFARLVREEFAQAYRNYRRRG